MKVLLSSSMSAPGLWRMLVLLSTGLAAGASSLTRVANTTLALPPEPPRQGYTLVDAFPDQRFNLPSVIASPPGETNRLFVAQIWGQIFVLTNLSNPTRHLFLDLSHKVTVRGGGEEGLVGLAFHPDFARNRQFFVFYTRSNYVDEPVGLYDQLSRFEVFPDDPTRADPASEVPLITQFDESTHHQAGDLTFGPDGYLYVALGDEGGDHLFNSQRIDKDFFSGILRLDVDRRPGNLEPNPHPAASPNYRVPKDNPFVGATSFNGAPVDPTQVRTEFWAVGLRNPFRITFDPAADVLYAADVGQSRWEEINIIRKGGNYGWNYYEGTRDYEFRRETPPPGFTFIPPLYEYPHETQEGWPANFTGICVIGGVVYRGTSLSQLHGYYVFADFVSRHVWALTHDGDRLTDLTHLTTAENSITTFGRDPRNGDVLLAEFAGSARILRLEYNDQPTGDPIPEKLSETGAFRNLATLEPHPGIVPYDIVHPFWSDHAIKQRWFSLPDPEAVIGFDPLKPWAFPPGMVWIKHFDLELRRGDPTSRRRLETRFLVMREAGGVYGVTYRWNDSQDEAFLVPEVGLTETFEVRDGDVVSEQVWHYPGRGECLACHTAAGGHALGFNTRQLNLTRLYGDQLIPQVHALAQAGYFANPPESVEALPRLAAINDTAIAVESRARSFLDVNCAYCHQPGGTGRGTWDARITTPLSLAGIIDAPAVNGLGLEGARLLKPGNPAISVMWNRVARWDGIHMPPLATTVLNNDAIDLLQQWIAGGTFIVGRHVFYGLSAWDANRGEDEVASASSAIAPDKKPLLPGGTASFENYTSFILGITGIIVDIFNLPSDLRPSDFTFRTGNDNQSANWNLAPPPESIVVRRGAGDSGADRVVLRWPGGVITNCWLEVTIKPGVRTGLASPDVFYFGNAIAESGNNPANAEVDEEDELLARVNATDPASIDHPNDYTRDGRVDEEDALLAGNHRSIGDSAVKLIDFTNSPLPSASEPLVHSPHRLRVLRREADQVVVTFDVASHRRYHLEVCDDLTVGDWREAPGPLTSDPAEGTATWALPLGSGNGGVFVRLVEDPSD